MSNSIILDNRFVDYNLIISLKELFSNTVSQKYLDEFYLLKGSVEGWKKGTLLRLTNHKVKTSSEKTRENLQLYTNQLAYNNYNIIFDKIKIEIEHGTDGILIFQDIILKDAIRQGNNLEILAKISLDLNITDSLFDKLFDLLSKTDFISNDNNLLYDQFCLDNIANLVFKNRYLFLCVFYNMNIIDNIFEYLDKLVSIFMNETDKKISEKYILTFIECLKKIKTVLKTSNLDEFNKRKEQLTNLLTMTSKITSKSSISIMNLLDEFI